MHCYSSAEAKKPGGNFFFYLYYCSYDFYGLKVPYLLCLLTQHGKKVELLFPEEVSHYHFEVKSTKQVKLGYFASSLPSFFSLVSGVQYPGL